MSWKKRKIDLDEVQVTAEQFHASYDAMIEWLDKMEQRLSEQPPVGTELDVVKEQLKVHKVSTNYLGMRIRLCTSAQGKPKPS